MSIEARADFVDPVTSRWPRRLIVAAVITLLPLFVFGGSVTTLGAGMAVEGWWDAEDHFMPFFPIEKWFRDLDTFVEHTHRQFGLVLGLLMIAACIATWIHDARRSARLLVIAALVAIGVQGWIGGSRVLENSPRLAFLHGTCAQAVFALMAAVLVHQSRTWVRASPVEVAAAATIRRLAVIASVILFAQVTLGAWYRHALRTGLEGDLDLRFSLHLFGAFVVVGIVHALASKLRKVASNAGEPLGRLATHLKNLLNLQIVLGFVAWAAREEGRVSFGEWLFATVHLLCGALMLALTVAAAMWSRRILRERPTDVLAASVVSR